MLFSNDSGFKYVKVDKLFGKSVIAERQTGEPLQFVTSNNAVEVATQWEIYFTQRQATVNQVELKGIR